MNKADRELEDKLIAELAERYGMTPAEVNGEATLIARHEAGLGNTDPVALKMDLKFDNDALTEGRWEKLPLQLFVDEMIAIMERSVKWGRFIGEDVKDDEEFVAKLRAVMTEYWRKRDRAL